MLCTFACGPLLLFAQTEKPKFGQTQKGDQLIGGLTRVPQPYILRYFSYGSYRLYYQRFIFKNFSVGGNANYSYAHSRQQDWGYKSAGLGVEARYYLLDGPVRLYTYAGVGKDWYWNSYPIGKSSPYFKSWTVDAGIGANWFFRPNLALEARMGYSCMLPSPGHVQNGSFTAQIGLVYRIPHNVQRSMKK